MHPPRNASHARVQRPATLGPSMYAPNTLRCEAGPKTRKLFSIIITGNDATGKGVLFQCIKTTACIDGATRKMISAVGCDPASLQANPVRVQVIPVPVRHFRWRMRVAHSDTDVNQHVNQAMYCRYCTDAAASATHHGHLHYFRGDFYNYRVKQIDVLYQGEAFPDDELDVCVWEDENLANTLHFQILNGTSHVTFCTMLFNSPVISKLWYGVGNCMVKILMKGSMTDTKVNAVNNRKNPKGTPWNSTQNILPMHWDMCTSYKVNIWRPLRFK